MSNEKTNNPTPITETAQVAEPKRNYLVYDEGNGIYTHAITFINDYGDKDRKSIPFYTKAEAEARAQEVVRKYPARTVVIAHIETSFNVPVQSAKF